MSTLLQQNLNAPHYVQGSSHIFSVARFMDLHWIGEVSYPATESQHPALHAGLLSSSFNRKTQAMRCSKTAGGQNWNQQFTDQWVAQQLSIPHNVLKPTISKVIAKSAFLSSCTMAFRRAAHATHCWSSRWGICSLRKWKIDNKEDKQGSSGRYYNLTQMRQREAAKVQAAATAVPHLIALPELSDETVMAQLARSTLQLNLKGWKTTEPSRVTCLT